MQVPFHYTHVEYEKGDILGFLLSLFSLLPIFIIVSFLTLILEKPRAVLVFGFIGQLLNEGFNAILKNYYKIPRPFIKGNGFGFPSSHAQFMGYFMGYFLIMIFGSHFRISKFYYLYYFGLSIGGLCTCYSRVYLDYHTADQVVAGLLLGLIAGVAWGFLIGNFKQGKKMKK